MQLFSTFLSSVLREHEPLLSKTDHLPWQIPSPVDSFSSGSPQLFLPLSTFHLFSASPLCSQTSRLPEEGFRGFRFRDGVTSGSPFALPPTLTQSSNPTKSPVSSLLAVSFYLLFHCQPAPPQSWLFFSHGCDRKVSPPFYVQLPLDLLSHCTPLPSVFVCSSLSFKHNFSCFTLTTLPVRTAATLHLP